MGSSTVVVRAHTHTHTYTHPQEWVTLRPISRVSVLGKSVLPRVLVRVTLLLPAHLPVLIGQRVSHSGGCRWWSVVSVVVCRAREQTTTSCNKRSRHGGTFPTQGDAILRNVKPVIPSVLVSLPRYIIKCSGGKDGLCWGSAPDTNTHREH